MSRKVIPLTPEAFATVPAARRACVTWELDPVRRRQADPGRAIGLKQDWLQDVEHQWGCCGQLLQVGGATAGFALYAPPAYVPGADAFPTAPVSADAVVLTHLWVEPAHRGGGLGRMLVQGMARDLVRRGGVAAVEAFGAAGSPLAAFGRREACLLPVEFLGGVGFTMHRPHPSVPRLRMDLEQTISWRDGVEGAWERLVRVVRPRRAPSAPLARARD